MSTKRNILLAIFIVTVTSTSLIFASDISSLISDLADWNKEKAKNASDKLARIGKPAVAQLVREQAYRDFLDEPWRGDFFGAAGCRQPVMA